MKKSCFRKISNDGDNESNYDKDEYDDSPNGDENNDNDTDDNHDSSRYDDDDNEEETAAVTTTWD